MPVRVDHKEKKVYYEHSPSSKTMLDIALARNAAKTLHYELVFPLFTTLEISEESIRERLKKILGQ